MNATDSPHLPLSASPRLLPLPPLPPPWRMRPLPPRLRFEQVVLIVSFWGLGTERYVRELRDCGLLVSVNEWPSGQRARYASEDVLRLYPRSAAAVVGDG